MQAQAAESRRRFAMTRPYLVCGRAVARRAKAASGYAGQPPPLFELRRVRKVPCPPNRGRPTAASRQTLGSGGTDSALRLLICRSSDALRFVLRPDKPKIAAQGGCSLRFRLVILLDLHLMARPLRLLVRRRRKKLYIDGFRHRLVTRPVGVQQLPRASSRVVRLHGRFHGAGSRIQRRCIKICHGIK
jgi:hypothetical protein